MIVVLALQIWIICMNDIIIKKSEVKRCGAAELRFMRQTLPKKMNNPSVYLPI